MSLQDVTMNQPKRVLVVDDEEGVREIVSEMIADMGFSVCGAESGEDALKLLKKTKVDLVISDVKIKGMDGLSLARRLRKRFPKLPLALMTAFDSADVRKMVSDRKVDFLLLKPFYMDELRGMVQHLTC
ncbi:MAG: response regulator [bacterium]|nr:response regulator [bacterium]